MRNPHRCIQRDERRNKGKASDSESTHRSQWLAHNPRLVSTTVPWWNDFSGLMGDRWIELIGNY
ncbi:hypothetical protein NC651_006644 [Populus alba x Populus x berolinensis]|nr:hypothetical protein NC651_006644 [Populus alba x Populus x berolinensis]